MSTRTNNLIEQLRASLADEPEVWSRPLRLLAEALLAHRDAAPVVDEAFSRIDYKLWRLDEYRGRDVVHVEIREVLSDLRDLVARALGRPTRED